MAWIENPAEMREAQREGWIDKDGRLTRAGKERMKYEDQLVRDGYRGDPRKTGR